MNILMLLSQLEATGAEVYAVTLAKSFSQKKHKLFIISDTLTLSCQADFKAMPISNRDIFHRVKNVVALVEFINKNNVTIVHAHSRAAAWVGWFACTFCRIPLVVTVHGRQSTFLSRKIFKCFGNYTIAVCEEVRKQLADDFNIPQEKMEVLRNGFDYLDNKYKYIHKKKSVVSYITRFSGPKGDIAFEFLTYLQNKKEEWSNIEFRIIGGIINSDRFNKFRNEFEFTGFVDCVDKYICESDVVIGSGRAAIEALINGKPTIAVGEAMSIGLIDESNFDLALRTNFGDIAEFINSPDLDFLASSLKMALELKPVKMNLIERTKSEYDIRKISNRIEEIYNKLVNQNKKNVRNG